MAVETKPKIYTFSMWDKFKFQCVLSLALFSKQKCTSMKFLCKRVSHKNLSTFFFLLYGVSYCCTEEGSQSFKSACWESETFLHSCHFFFWMTDEVVIKTYRSLNQLILNLLCGKLWFLWEEFRSLCNGFQREMAEERRKQRDEGPALKILLLLFFHC